MCFVAGGVAGRSFRCSWPCLPGISAHAGDYRPTACPLSFLVSRRVSGANTPIYGAQRR